MKHIIFLTPQLKTGGGNRVFIELANQLVESGYCLDIICPHNSEQESVFFIGQRIKVHKVGRLRTNFTGKLWNIFLTLIYVRRFGRGCAIIVSDQAMSIAGFMLFGLNVYRFIQGDDYRIYDDLFLLKRRFFLKIYKMFTKISYQYRVKYIFNSRFSYDAFLAVSGRKDVAFCLVHPAFNPEIFYDYHKRPEKWINLCLMGRRHPLKGFADFLKAWADIKDQMCDVVGKVFVITDEGLSQFDLSNFEIVRPGCDRDIAETLNLSHIFISPSRQEGFGLPALEAMACGCAVILTDVGGAREYARPGENCLVYEAGNTCQLKENILKLTGDVSLIQKLSLNAQTVSKEFSWLKSAEQFKKCLGVSHV